LAAIALTTETVAPFPVERRLGIVTGTCIFGQHIGRDIATFWRDFVGGRAKAAEHVFASARSAALDALRLEAVKLGATAVVAVQVSHQELGGGGKSMVMVTATGTAVK